MLREITIAACLLVLCGTSADALAIKFRWKIPSFNEWSGREYLFSVAGSLEDTNGDGLIDGNDAGVKYTFPPSSYVTYQDEWGISGLLLYEWSFWLDDGDFGHKIVDVSELKIGQTFDVSVHAVFMHWYASVGGSSGFSYTTGFYDVTGHVGEPGVIEPIPLPATGFLLGSLLTGLGMARRFRRG